MEELREKIIALLEKYFYGKGRKYHVSMTSRLVVEKIWNRGMGRMPLFKVRLSDNAIWVNDGLATRGDYARLTEMLTDNDLNLTIVKKSYAIWDRTWSDIDTAA